MKLNKKVISFLLSAILITTSVALPVSANDDTSTDYSYGDIFEDYEPNYSIVENSTNLSDGITFYDPRTTNSMTPVKDQMNLGTCSFFTTCAVAETASYVQTGLKYTYSEEAMRYALSDSLRIVNNVTNEGEKGFYIRSSIEGASVYTGSSYITHRNNPIIDNNTKTWLSPNSSQDVPYTNELHKDDLNYWPAGLDTSFANAYASETRFVRESEMKDAVLKYGAVYARYGGDGVSTINENTGAVYCHTRDLKDIKYHAPFAGG